MKRFLPILFIFNFCTLVAQNQMWRSFFSYNNIVDISQSDNRVYAASESAMFSQSLTTSELKTITSVDGLKAETITAIHHSSVYNKTLVGNGNGLLFVINADNAILSVVGILQETNIPSNKKKINHIYEYEGKAYISCDFGIAVFNLSNSEFGDTYYIGTAGEQIPVMQSTVLNGTLYAATIGYGIRKGQLGNPNLNDFTQWDNEISSGNWQNVISFNNQLYATDGSNNVYTIQAGTTTFFTQVSSTITDLRDVNGFMLITSLNRIDIYNNQLILLSQINKANVSDENFNFTCASIINNEVFIGTNTKGLFTAQLNSLSFQNITPDGPLRSSIFSLEKTPNSLWAVYGGYNYQYVPDVSEFGLSKFSTEGWLHIPYEDVFGARSLSDIAVNPNNENEVYIGSYHSGLLKIENDETVILYDQNNTGENGLETLVDSRFPGYISVRINSLTYDKSGNLWMTNSLIDKPLKVLKSNGQWQSYSFLEVSESIKQNNYGKMVIDKNGTKWIPSEKNGIIAFNETLGNKFIVISEDSGLPTYNSRCVAVDNRNQLWIGTVNGLRVVSGIDRFLTETELTANPVIIMEEGLAQELMYGQVINTIVVDGANNKWIGTSAGAFLVSPDGQRTIFHFTKQNSPLPSNVIYDIEIDAATGEVFFATDKGMVSYQGTSTKASGDLNNVYVFPNPVRPGFDGDVNISGLVDKANIKITDIEGNLVYETTSEGGTVLWDTRAFGRYKVASGVYMIFIASEDGTETKVKKVMIVR
jgi:hypothetical protein